VLVIALVVVLVAAEQVPPWSILVVGGATALGVTATRLGAPAPARVWAIDVVLVALVSLVVCGALLPDTEGPVLVVSALGPVTVGLLVRRLWWRGGAGVAASTALVTTVGIVAIDAAAGRSGTLVVAAVTAAVCGTGVVLVGRVLVDRRSGPTAGVSASGRGRPLR
jgi:hypothetical protein